VGPTGQRKNEVGLREEVDSWAGGADSGPHGYFPFNSLFLLKFLI
jgi:hypothetical protein